MNNITNKKNKDVILRIKQKRTRKRNLKKNQIYNKANPKDKEPEIPKVQEYLDIALSCDNMFQYIYENNFLNKRYYYTLVYITFFALIMNYLSGMVILALMRMPEYAYEYECFSIHNYSYQKCSFRDLCYCNADDVCVTVCQDSRLACRDFFLDFHSKRQNNILRTDSMSHEIYVRFPLDNTHITIFNKIKTNYCDLKYYNIFLNILCFVGGSLGLFLSGILADYYGKRKVIMWVSITIVLENMVMILFSRYTVGDYKNITEFFIAWGFIIFFSGFSLFTLEYLVLLNFIEFYPDPKSIKHINAYMHSQFTFTNLSFVCLNTLIKNLFIFYYISIAFFTGLFFIFLFYFEENPRFYSERRDYDMKMKTFKKIIQKVLVKKNDKTNNKIKDEVKDEIGNHNVYWKELVLTNVIKNKKQQKSEVENNLVNLKSILALTSRNNRPHLGNVKHSRTISEKEWNKVRVMMYNQKKSKLINSEFQKKLSMKNFGSRREIVINEKREIFNEGLGNEEINPLLKSKRLNVLNLFKIYRKFFRDKYVKKYFFIFTLLWTSIIYCFYGATFNVVFKLANPNQANLYESVGVIIYSFLVVLLTPTLIGNLSGIIPLDDKYFVMMTIFIYSLITIFLDSNFIMPDADRIYFYSSKEDIEKYRISSISVSTSSALIITTVSLFNLLLITSVPTAYRTVFVSSIKAIGNLIPIFTFLSFYLLDTPILTCGIISLCGFIIFFSLHFKWRDVKLVESVDNEDMDKKKNKKIKINSKRMQNIKNLKQYSHSKTMNNRASIFNRVKQYSYN
jgi:hypothetical protein